MPSRYTSLITKALVAAALLFSILLASCSAPRRRLASLDLEAKAAQVLLIGVDGSGLPSRSSVDLLERMEVGGVLLFAYNLPPEPVETGRFTAALQDAAARGAASRGEKAVPLIVAIDHEGGLVFRFKGEGITRIPSAEKVGEKGGRYASRYAAALGEAAGSELRALGISMNLAPVVELLGAGNEAFLGSRAYGSSGSVVDAAAGAYIEGLQSRSVAAVGKHFPGNAAADPHKVLPRLDISRAVYERDYLPRFSSAIRRGVSSVMLSHVLFEAVDPAHPSSLSAKVIRGELRGRLGFSGLAITDDLGMGALSSSRSPEEAAVEALNAGADLLMLVDMDKAPAVRQAIVRAVEEGKLSRGRLDEAVYRMLALKSRYKLDSELDPKLRSSRLASFPSIVEANAKKLRAFEP
jgi:beta-N-acetylhexosaminidase